MYHGAVKPLNGVTWPGLALIVVALLPACRPAVMPPPPPPPMDPLPQPEPPRPSSTSNIDWSASNGPIPPTGPGLTLSANLETTRVAQWDGPLTLTPWRTPAPDLPGRAIGMLWAGALYEGRDVCAAYTANDRVEYKFSRGPHPSYALYFPSDGRGFNFIPQWIVPLPDGTTVKYDAAMFRPDTANPWGLHACAHLVELDVNDGRGGRDIHFVATRVRVLDNTTAYPWSLARVLLDLRARHDAHAREYTAALAFTRPERGPWREQVTSGLIPTWTDPPGRLDVLVWRTATRTAELGGKIETVVAYPCADGTPCAYQNPGTFQEFEVLTETIEFAVLFAVDATGALTHETIHAPRRHTADSRVRRKIR